MNTKDIQYNSRDVVLYILFNETPSTLLDAVLAINRHKPKPTAGAHFRGEKCNYSLYLDLIGGIEKN